ncbi:hypothetical protein [Nocardia mexicana]|uniref:Uncharacterized protein n=1 Tax=Nocardia mexicana TaxID=279262 RepID=A0A370GXU9_9NOCA|nr:hypothetical protein [Nocardia mexicana]RDI48472.1 hypothetical protein DFR68_108305 [Nocardia mexicana]
MNWRTRLFEFPGGLLEVQAYLGSDPEGGPGVFMELVYGDDGRDGVSDCEQL